MKVVPYSGPAPRCWKGSHRHPQNRDIIAVETPLTPR
jgi:hypothetical protein